MADDNSEHEEWLRRQEPPHETAYERMKRLRAGDYKNPPEEGKSGSEENAPENTEEEEEPEESEEGGE